MERNDAGSAISAVLSRELVRSPGRLKGKVEELNRPLRTLQRLSFVTPAYNEQASLPLLYDRLYSVVDSIGVDWEWIVVDDHSSDRTFDILSEFNRRNSRVKAIRLSRNHGSHAAISCGLSFAQGDCTVVLAADLQDPPETIPKLVQTWQEGAHVVWATRAKHDGENRSRLSFPSLYYWLMRSVVGLSGMPASGADFMLLDRRVVKSLGRFRERNVSLLSLITWMGFKQETIPYVKEARMLGSSGWNFSKKVKLVVDSVVSFSFFPLRAMSLTGFIVAGIGILYALAVIVNALIGNPTQGWSSLMVVVLLLGGLQMLMMGVLGEYLWRSLDENRRRPRFLIEDEVGLEIQEHEG